MITRRVAASGLAATFAGLFRIPAAHSAAPATPDAQSGKLESPVVWNAGPAKWPLRADSLTSTDVWTLDGTLSPTLRIKHGSRIRLTLNNGTPGPLALHFHGVRGSGPRQAAKELTPEPTEPGGSSEYSFIPPDSGSFLIRPCILGQSAEPAERGLTGLLVVEENEPLPVDHDLALVIDDWLLAEDGSLAPFASQSGTPLGRLGNVLTVNGAPVPRTFEFAPSSRIRLRLANACNARILPLRFTGPMPSVIAVDGQPTEPFEPAGAALPVLPGSRYDLLLHLPEASGLQAQVSAAIGNGVPLVTIRTAGARPTQLRRQGSRLPRNHTLLSSIRLEKAVRRDVVLTGDRDTPWAVNGAPGHREMAPVLTVKQGSPVVAALINRTPFPQAFHLHGHVFRLLHGLDDGWEPYFLDTVLVPANRTARIAFVADRPGRWLLASTIMERFDAGLWTWIEVT